MAAQPVSLTPLAASHTSGQQQGSPKRREGKSRKPGKNSEPTMSFVLENVFVSLIFSPWHNLPVRRQTRSQNKSHQQKNKSQSEFSLSYLRGPSSLEEALENHFVYKLRGVWEMEACARILYLCTLSALLAPFSQGAWATARSKHEKPALGCTFLAVHDTVCRVGDISKCIKKKKVVQLLLYFYKSATKPYRVRKLRYWVKGGSSSKSAPRPTACGVLLSMVCQGLTRPCMDVHAQLIVVNTRAHMLMHKRVTHWPRRPAPTYVLNDIAYYFACSSSPTLPEK